MAHLAKSVGIAGTVLSAVGPMYAGREAEKAASAEADYMRRRAGARRAEAQAAAREERRLARLKSSRAQAVAAASGASLADPTVVNLMGDIDAEGEYGALTQMYEGYDEASGLDQAATARQKEGRAARTAGMFQGVVNAMSGAQSLYAKYGKPGGRKKKR